LLIGKCSSGHERQRRRKKLAQSRRQRKEAVQIAVDTPIPAQFDQIRAQRGLLQVIRSDNGPKFAGRTMQAWAARNGVQLRFIELGKPVQNAYVESLNSRFRDECLSQHWFASLSHMRSVIDNWRQGYNCRRPYSALGGAGVFVQVNVHGDAPNHGCNCSIRGRMT
jgi:transposase InsO family protein